MPDFLIKDVHKAVQACRLNRVLGQFTGGATCALGVEKRYLLPCSQVVKNSVRRAMGLVTKRMANG